MLRICQLTQTIQSSIPTTDNIYKENLKTESQIICHHNLSNFKDSHKIHLFTSDSAARDQLLLNGTQLVNLGLDSCP